MRDTSLEAFSKLRHLSEKQATVYHYILWHPNVTDKQIAEGINWPINCTTPRRLELERMRVIESSGRSRPKGEKCWQHQWRVTEQSCVKHDIKP